ncbi:glycosyltransferase [Salidesulfovibrio brasiliensis]
MDFVVFAEDWGGHPSSTQHIVTRLIRRGHRVVWFNSIGLRNPRFTPRDIRRMGSKLAGALRRENGNGHTPENGTAPLEAISSVVIPKPDNRLFRSINRSVLSAKVRDALKRHGMDRPVLWITTPTAECVCDAAKFSSVLYYCCDDYGALPGVDPDFVRRLEQVLAGRADRVMVTHPLLARRFPPEKVFDLPHGVDCELFSNDCPRADDLPQGPVAGYYGSISSWLDITLLKRLATELPHWTLVLVGAVETDVSELEALENVRLLGPRPHALLPGYSRHWDVSLLPFVNNSQIEHCSPLKLREYLAAGRPVVSVGFPAVRDYADVVAIAEPGDAEGFIRLVQEAGDGRDEARRERVVGESWDSRAVMVETLLE